MVFTKQTTFIKKIKKILHMVQKAKKVRLDTIYLKESIQNDVIKDKLIVTLT